MNRKFYLLFTAFALFSLLSHADVGTAVDQNSTVFWKLGLGGAGQTATYSNAADTYFKADYITVGTNLSYKDTRTTSDVTYTRLQPAAKVGSSAITDDCLISFNISPKTGLNFMPNKVTFNMMRYGTGGGNVDVYWKSADGTKTELIKTRKPIRDNEAAVDSVASAVTVDLAGLGITATEGECALLIYLYDLDPGKQVGFANLAVEGNVSGNLVNIPTFTVNTSVSPTGAGSISTNPVGTVFDQNTSLTLTADKNFGYSFKQWEDGTGNLVSTDNPYTFTVTQNKDLVAVYDVVPTFSLNLTVEGGAKDYMVAIEPAGTMVNDVRMYETGTSVTLAAGANEILSFNKWGDNSTDTSLTITMDQEQDITATYTAVDYIAAWDFYAAGNRERPADFYAIAANGAAYLTLFNSSFDAISWLDKSADKGGYEGQNAAVNWSPIADNSFYMIAFDASAYADITVKSQMLLNYNAYSIQNLEYSIDGSTWDNVGTITMTATKEWYKSSVTLPAAANNQATVFFRWIPDYTSTLVGATSTNDGTALSQIFVTGTTTTITDAQAVVADYSVIHDRSANALLLSGVDMVQVYSIGGVKLIETETASDYLSLSSLVPGAYIVRAQVNGEFVSVKIVK